MKTAEYTLNVADVVKLEHRIEQAGTPLYELMKGAGGALARAAQAHTPGDARVVILAGTGNNGGDGWVAAGLLATAGLRVSLVTPKKAEELSAEPARSAALKAIRVADLDIFVNPEKSQLEALCSQADVVIDALLGTGFSGAEVHEPLASWIKAANDAYNRGAYLIAADVPSGINAQTGAAATPHIRANETITMIAAKPGLFREAGFKAAGQVRVATICDLAPFSAYLKSHAVSRFDFESLVVDIPDYPTPGVVFKDITPLLSDAAGFNAAIEALASHFAEAGVTKVVGAEARGFMVGAPLATHLKAGFVPARKPGKLPREALSESYALEYGTDTLEIHADALNADDVVLIVDDLAATGGTAAAQVKLVQRSGARLAGLGFLMELAFLNPRTTIAKATDAEVFSLIHVN